MLKLLGAALRGAVTNIFQSILRFGVSRGWKRPRRSSQSAGRRLDWDMRRLTLGELISLIEENDGPEQLDLTLKDLSGLWLDHSAIRRELRARGISQADDAPCWAHVVGEEVRGINLERAYLISANLRGTVLSDASLKRTMLDGSDLQWAKLVGTNLEGARLCYCNLREVDLTEVESLDRIYLFRAWLERTDLTGAQLGGGIGEEQDREYYQAKEAYLALKNNFEKIGRYDDASWAYIKERKMEKMMNHPQLAREYYAKAEGLSHGANWRSRRLWSFYFRHTLKWGGDWLVELTCGYGERFVRVLATLVAVYGLFTVLFGLTWSVMRVTSGPEGATRTFAGNPVDWAIFSLGALTTMDPAGLEPRNNIVQLAAGLEALLGIFLTGLLGFVVANRIRRS